MPSDRHCRLVHLVDPSIDENALPALQYVRQRLSPQRWRQDVIAFGPRLAESLSARLACPVRALPRGFEPLDWMSPDWIIDRALRDVPPHADDTVLHAWGASALKACRRRSDLPAVLTMLSPPAGTREIRRLQAWQSAAVVHTSGQAVRRRIVECGVPPERVVVIRGPIDFRAVNEARGMHLRRRWWGGGTGPVILLAADASCDAGAFNGAWAAAMLQQVHAGAGVVAPFDTARDRRIRRFLDANGLGAMYLAPPSQATWAELVTAADVMLASASAPVASEPVAWAIGAGLPVVGVAAPATTELIADRHSGVLAREDSPRELAAALLRMLDDPELRHRVSETARAEAYEIFSIRAFIENIQRLYENLLSGRPASDQVEDTAMARPSR